MALRKGLPAKLAATDADDTRYDLAGLIVCNADGTPRGGVLSPVGVNLVTATGTMNVSVARFQGAAVRDSGVVLLANDGPTNVLLENAPSANSRIDVVWAKQNDASSTVSVPDANSLPVFGVTKGDAAPIPVKKAIPDGALELATVQVPSTATATNSSGVVITQTAPFTAAAGGVVPFRTKVELDAWTNPGVGVQAWVIPDNTRFVRSGGVWVAGGSTFAEAAGEVAQGANITGSVVVMFPAGRFTTAPVVSAVLTRYVANAQIMVQSKSATQMTVLTYNISTGAQMAALSFDWTARQMTPTSGAG